MSERDERSAFTEDTQTGACSKVRSGRWNAVSSLLAAGSCSRSFEAEDAGSCTIDILSIGSGCSADFVHSYIAWIERVTRRSTCRRSWTWLSPTPTSNSASFSRPDLSLLRTNHQQLCLHKLPKPRLPRSAQSTRSPPLKLSGTASGETDAKPRGLQQQADDVDAP